MYTNLNLERVKSGLTWRNIADKSGINYNTLTKKLYDDADFTVSQAKAIKQAIGSNMTLEKLFAND